MKRFLPIVVSILLISFVIPIQAEDTPPSKLKLRDSQGSAEEGPGLKETLEWLKSKISALDVPVTKTSKYISREEITRENIQYYSYEFLYDECTITLYEKIDYRGTLHDYPQKNTYMVDLHDLNYKYETKSTSSEDISSSVSMISHYEASFKSKEDKRKVSAKRKFGDYPEEITANVAGIYIVTPSDDLAERISTALSHAIKLCNQMPKKKINGNELF